MKEFVCRTASREELLKRWEYLVAIHPGDSRWVGFRENALKHYDEKSTISYMGFLDGEIICEATAYVDNSAFLGDIHDPSGLLNDTMSYLAAFRTNQEYEGQGYLKVFGRTQDGPALISYNKKYDPIPILPEREFRIAGRVLN